MVRCWPFPTTAILGHAIGQGAADTLVFMSEKYYAIKLHSQLRRLCRIASIKSYCDWTLLFWYHVAITEL